MRQPDHVVPELRLAVHRPPPSSVERLLEEVGRAEIARFQRQREGCRPSCDSAGTPGSISGPIVKAPRPSAETTAPEVSPPATTRRRVPPIDQRARRSRRRGRRASRRRSRGRSAACDGADLVGRGRRIDERRRPALRSTKATRRVRRRPRRHHALDIDRQRRMRCAMASIWPRVALEQTPARIASGPRADLEASAGCPSARPAR